MKTLIKKFNINLSKVKAKLCLSLRYNGDNIHLFVNGKKSTSLKQIIKMTTFQINFAWEAYLISLIMSRQKKYL